jgi:hypothetical protein
VSYAIVRISHVVFPNLGSSGSSFALDDDSVYDVCEPIEDDRASGHGVGLHINRCLLKSSPLNVRFPFTRMPSNSIRSELKNLDFG